MTTPGAQRMGFFTDTTVCIGCKACEVACKQWNDLPADDHGFRGGAGYDHTGSLSASTWRHVRFVEVLEANPVDVAGAVADMDRWVFMSDVCKHCTNPGCLDACPTGALVKTEFDSVILQPDVCNGCGYCIPACPFGVVDRDQIDGRAAKCTLCYDRLSDGLEPACAKACPTDSIQFGPHDELVERAQARVLTLHERGVDGAYLYGAGDRPGEEIAGGLGAFFLLTEPPERFGLPAERRLPHPRERHAGDARGDGRGARRRRRCRRGVPAPAETAMRNVTPAVGDARRAGRLARAPWRARASRCTAAAGPTAPGRSSTAAGTPRYAEAAGDRDKVAEANRRARAQDVEPPAVQGPVMKAPVWTWEVPLYFWFGGIAAGSSFVALACDLDGDHRSAAVARKVALGAFVPCPPLLIADLGRPERFHHMLRIVKFRSPLSMGVWALTLFGNLAGASVAADLLGRRRLARALGGANAVVSGYLGSYAGVLLASTAVPVWARSRLFLGPIFVSTATATGAAATRLALVATGLERGHPTRIALGRVETGAMAAELVLSEVNERRLGDLAKGLHEGRAGRLFRTAKWLVRAGLALRLAPGRPAAAHHAASVVFLGAGLCFRYAWVAAGPSSAHDDAGVARMARARPGQVFPCLFGVRGN